MGYDPGFMALMPAALELAPEHIAAGDVWIATGADGQIAGVVALAPGGCAGHAGLKQAFHRAAPHMRRSRPGAARARSRRSAATRRAPAPKGKVRSNERLENR